MWVPDLPQDILHLGDPVSAVPILHKRVHGLSPPSAVRLPASSF